MITAVDTSVLLDVLTADPKHGPSSKEGLKRARADGRLVAGEVVWAEVAGQFESSQLAYSTLDQLGVEFEPMSRDAALAAGAAWRQYRQAGGSRTRVIADFLVGAHAAAHADRLLTRDRGFYRSSFPDVDIVDPTRGRSST